MLQNKTFFAALGVAALFFALSPLQAATQLRINAAGDLEVVDGKDQLVKSLPNGTISETVKADNQAFKVSYGKDLKGRFTTIVYPDPEKPQTISLSVFKQDVTISPDAVLTVVAEKDLATATLQSGVVGKVSVAGTDLAGGNSLKIQNGSVVVNTPPPPAPVVETPEAPVRPPAKSKSKPAVVVAETPKPAPKPEEAPVPAPAPATTESNVPSATVPKHYDGAHTRKVEGDVMVAPKGQTVVDAVKNSPTPPRLDLNEAVAPGSTIQTGPNGKAYVSPFPGAVLMIEPNSTVEFEELQWRNTNGKIEHKMTANVKEGSVISAIKGIKPEELDYKVKTPHGVAAARGTVYITRNNGTSTTVIVSQGKVQVVTSKGTFTLGVDAGNKITITADGPEGPTDVRANADEIRAAEALWAGVQDFISLNDWGSSANGGTDTGGAASPTLDGLIQSFQSTFSPDLNPAPMTPTNSP